MSARQDCLVAVLIGGHLHRTWTPRSADAKRYAKALSKLPGIEGVEALQDRQVRDEDGRYRWRCVTLFAWGQSLEGRL